MYRYILDVDRRREYIKSHERLLDNRRAKVSELERQLCAIADDVARFTATLVGLHSLPGVRITWT